MGSCTHLEVWVEDLGNDNVTLNWCSSPDAQDYVITIDNGSTPQTIIVSDNTTTISGLTSGTDYEFRVQSRNSSGLRSHSTVPVKATPSASPTVDLWIDNVTFNQTVQIPLDSNNMNTPLIAGKPGRLRVFVGVSGNTDGLRSTVRLEGSTSSGNLTPVESEFSLRHTPKDQAEEYYHPVDFDLPNEYLQSGVSIKIIIDSNNTNSEIDEGNNIYPNSGYKSLSFIQKPSLKIRWKMVLVISELTIRL